MYWKGCVWGAKGDHYVSREVDEEEEEGVCLLAVTQTACILTESKVSDTYSPI